MIEYITRVNPPVMVARGILHGCIGKCCSREYPSVFANLGDKSIWNFIVDKTSAQTFLIDDKIGGDDSQTLLIVLILVILILLLAFIILFIWFKRKKDKKSNTTETDSEVGEKLLEDNQPKIEVVNTENENDLEQSNDESDVEEDDSFKEVSLIRFPQKEHQIPWNEGFVSNNRAKMEALCPNASM